jgi:hypothetical protein
MWTMAMVDALAPPSRQRSACSSACHSRSSLGHNIHMSSLNPLSSHEQITAERMCNSLAHQMVTTGRGGEDRQ